MTALFLTLSTLFLLIAPITYVVSIIRGKTRPHRLTRLAVMAALLLSFASALAAGANPGILLLAGISAVHGVVIFVLSLWRGMGSGTRTLDWACFLLAVVGLAAWQLSGNALIGIWFAISADLVAFIPAYVKTWRNPGTESPWFSIFSVVGASLTLVAYPLQASSVFQMYIILGSLIMVICIYRRQLVRLVSRIN